MKVRKRFLFFFMGSVVLFVGLIFAAVSMIDSPGKMQLRKNDMHRLTDLKKSAEVILNRYQSENKLLESVVEVTVADSNRNYMRDAISGQPYDYRRISDYVFELCAIFETSNIDYGNSLSFYFAGKYMTLGHSEGKQCFKFDVQDKNKNLETFVK